MYSRAIWHTNRSSVTRGLTRSRTVGFSGRHTAAAEPGVSPTDERRIDTINTNSGYGATVADYQFTGYFEKAVLQKRPYLRKKWCVHVVEHPIRSEPQEQNRYRFWGEIAELKGRYLRVITLEDKRTIHKAFPTGGSSHESQLLSGHRLALH